MSFKGGDQSTQKGKKKAKKSPGGGQAAQKGDGTVRSVDGATDRAGAAAPGDDEDLLGGELINNYKTFFLFVFQSSDRPRVLFLEFQSRCCGIGGIGGVA